ncbi:hypothetical protein [Hyphomicrobium sp. DY-1]|uniref:hypothetical protein n=1 Tax=Hyphomicrobium sp. DY-1 TaxID=3075650 RepID=UPI0039C0079F
MIHVVAGEPGHLIAMHALAPADRRLALPALKPVPGRRLSPERSPYHAVQAQMALSESYALFETPDDPAPFALVGGATWPSGELEAWFVVRPGGLAPPLLLALVRFARAMFGIRPPAMCFVRPDNDQGERLAKLLGFVKSDVVLGDHHQWRREHVDSGEARRHSDRTERC